MIDFLINFYPKLKDFRALKSSRIELSSTRELNFDHFEILVSRSIFDGFGGQLGSQDGPKIDQKLVKKLIKKVIDFLIDF